MLTVAGEQAAPPWKDGFLPRATRYRVDNGNSSTPEKSRAGQSARPAPTVVLLYVTFLPDAHLRDAAGIAFVRIILYIPGNRL
jgi:hypothetical protein